MTTGQANDTRTFIAFYTIIGAATAALIACTDNVTPGTTSGGSEPQASTADSGSPSPAATTRADAGAPSDATTTPDAEADPEDTDGGLPSARRLVLWLDPTVGTVTDERGVSEWKDQSAAHTPTIVYNGPRVYQSDPNAVPVMSMGAGARFSISLASPLGTRPFATVFIARMFAADSATFFRTNDGESGFSFTMSGTNRLWVTAPHANGGATFSFNPSLPDPTGALHVFSMRRRGNTYDVRVDGSGQSASDPAGAYNLPADIVLFSQSPTHYMEIGDVLIYDADLSDAKLQAAEAYLKTKYKI